MNVNDRSYKHKIIISKPSRDSPIRDIQDKSNINTSFLNAKSPEMEMNQNSYFLSKTTVPQDLGGKGKMQNALSKIKQLGQQQRSPFDQQFKAFSGYLDQEGQGRKRRNSQVPQTEEEEEKKQLHASARVLKRNQTIYDRRHVFISPDSQFSAVEGIGEEDLGTQYETDSFKDKIDQELVKQEEEEELNMNPPQSNKEALFGSSGKSKLPPRIPLERVRSNSKHQFLIEDKGIPGSRTRLQNTTLSNPHQLAMTRMNNNLRNASLKYCQAVFIYFEGDTKAKFHIHSLAPIDSVVEISKKPELPVFSQFTGQKGKFGEQENGKNQRTFDTFPEWKCAQALKQEGDVFRILPAHEFINSEKVRRIVKSKKRFENKNMFKYGEYLESLNEEIKFNVNVFQNFKNQYLTFGSGIILMHEVSQQFLKISSPSMSDNSFQFKLKLSPNVSEKTIFKILPSNKLQQESEGKIHEYDQIYLAYAYDKILMKDLYLYTNPDKLYNLKPKTNLSSKAVQGGGSNCEMVFSEDKKLPLHLGLCPSLSFDYSENAFKLLNGKVIQIKHIESELYLTLTIKRKENRIMSLYFGDKNRYSLNKLVDYVPEVYSHPPDGGDPCTINVHFEARESINTYWKVHTSPTSRDIIYLENAVSGIKIVPFHLQLINRGASNQDQFLTSTFDSSSFYKLFLETELSNAQAPKMSGNLQNLLDPSHSDKQFLWVEYMKFIKTENRYEFSKFGKMNHEDKGNFFDSFSIGIVDAFKQHSLAFISNAITQIKEFDSYTADTDDSTEYDRLYQVLRSLKHFVLNKHVDLLNIDAHYGKPVNSHQDLIKESFLLDDLIELMGYIWPDEHYLKSEFQCEDDSPKNSLQDPHREVKMGIAEKILELLIVCCRDNVPIQEYMFFEIIPSVQKFVLSSLLTFFQFGVGFRKNQDFKLFEYLVLNSDKFAEYKEKSKYNIIFQFIKKLFVRIRSSQLQQKEKSNNAVRVNIITILSKFCINSQGEPNNYHQKLLHDLFFFNKMENLRFTLKFGKTSIYRAATFDPLHSKNVIEEEQERQIGLLTSRREHKEKTPLNRMLSDRPQTRSRKDLIQAEEIKLDLAQHSSASGQEQHPLKQSVTFTAPVEDFGSQCESPITLKAKDVDHSFSGGGQEPLDNFIRKQMGDDDTIGGGEREFLIKQIHDMSFEKLTQDFILEATENNNSTYLLDKIQLYFFADICYLMNFDCHCSKFTPQSVANLIDLLINGTLLDQQIKAGLARILNTVLRNHNDNIKSHPQYLRIYEKQEFKASKSQDIIQPKDVRVLIKLSRDHFKNLTLQANENITEYDSEIIRLMAFLIESDLIFSESFDEGLVFVNDLFANIGQFMVNSIVKQDNNMNRRASSLHGLSTRKHHLQDECTLNLEDFQKQFLRLKKLLQTNLENTAQGMIENPIAWKCLNNQKQYVSFVEKILKKKHKDQIKMNLEAFKEQEKARHHMVRFYLWLINLRIDQLLANFINMFHDRLESLINEELMQQKISLDDILKKPELLTSKFISQGGIRQGEASQFFEEILTFNQSDKSENYIQDIDTMFSQLMDKSTRKTTKASTNNTLLTSQRIETQPSPQIASEDQLLSPHTIVGRKQLSLDMTPKVAIQLNMLEEPKDEQTDIEPEIMEDIKTPFKSARQFQSENVQTELDQTKSIPLRQSHTLQPRRIKSVQINKKIDAQQQQDTQSNAKSINKQTTHQGKQLKILDVLIEMFVSASDEIFQQEIMRVMFKYMTIRKELLFHFQRTVVVFRHGIKPSIENLESILSKCKMLIQDSTIWEMPKENEQKNNSSPPQAIETLEDSIGTTLIHSLQFDSIESPMLTQLNLVKTRSTVHSQKQEYVQKIKEYQKNQNQIFQGLAFTKSNKTTDVKISKLDEFRSYLDQISHFFSTKTSQANRHATSSPQYLSPNSYQRRDLGFDEQLKLQPSDGLLEQLGHVQSDFQYAFLASEGHELIINFMEKNKELRQESVRILFFNQKSNLSSGEVKHESVEPSENQERIQYAYKVLITYKKCYEILIKFLYNNHTNKQVLLNYLEQILLFNSEYYMQSKMQDEMNLFDFELLNYIIENNYEIKHMSTIIIPKITNLVIYLLKIVEFPKKPFMFAPKILKVYSNIIANSDSQKINDLIVDIILREEEFFQIQGILLGKKYREAYSVQSDHFFIIENFLKGISGILRNQSIRMVKKKFYTIFNRMDSLQSYFDHLKSLFILNVNLISSNDEEDKEADRSFNVVLQTYKDDKNIQFFNEEDIVELGKRFLVIESLYVFIFYQLFFDIKVNQKQVQDKIDEMFIFLDQRDKDIEFLNQYIPHFEFEDWAQFQEFQASLDVCHSFCQKHKLKSSGSENFFPYKSFTLASQQSLKKIPSREIQQEEEEIKLKQQVSIRSRVRQSEEEVSEMKKEKIFLIFKWNVLHDDSLRGELKNEMTSFAKVLLSKFQKADSNSQELEAQKNHAFFHKLIEYAHKYCNIKNIEDTKLLVEFLSHFIDLTSSKETYKGESIEAKTVIQEKLNSIGAVSMVLELMCSDQNEIIDELFPQLLLFANRILDGAQNNVQDIFTEYLTKNESSINLFQRCYYLIEKEIQILQKLNSDAQPLEGSVSFKKSATMQDKSKLLTSGVGQKYNKNLEVGQEKIPKIYNKVINVQKQILKFFKNLCENHNTKIQLLIGNQQNHQKNFDMVSLTVNYLHSLISNIYLSKRNYTNAKHCCISLAEYVQGPCFVNQNLIKEANFFQLAVHILQMKPNLIQYTKDQEKKIHKNIKGSNLNQSINLSRSMRKSVSQIAVGLKDGRIGADNEFNMFNGGSESVCYQLTHEGDFTLSNFMIQKLKLNCTIILLSLLEQRTSDDPLLLSMKRSIPIEVIKQNIVYEYFLFCKDYKKFLSSENFFRHVLPQNDDKVKEELIIEVGFNLFFMLKRWSEDKKTNDQSLDDMMRMVDGCDVQVNAFVGTFKQLFEFLQYLTDSFKTLMKQTKKIITLSFYEKPLLHKRSSVEKFVFHPSSLLDALLFFKHNSGQIDVLTNEGIEQVYFPYMPYCTYLSEEEKRDFYNNLPTERDKEKIDSLINDSVDLIRKMKIEYQFKKFFINYYFMGAFVYYTELWKTFSFYTILVLNMMNLYSFHAVAGNDRMDSPQLFNVLSISATKSIYAFLGFFQILFALCIDVTIISKRLKYHYELTYQKSDGDEQKQQEETYQQTEKMPQQEQAEGEGEQKEEPKVIEQTAKPRSFRKPLSYILSALSDFYLLYYIGYLIFSFFGYFVHPFFYCYHMVDIIIRNPYLKNVLKALYRPRYELLNTLVLFLCMEYIFTIIAYINLFDDFGSNSCTSLSQCFLVTIDQTFKGDGGLGGFLEKSYPEDMSQGDSIRYGRFIFDNLFNVLLVILVVEIISGIIIDTFGALREEHNKITESIENKCMICGKNRDQIEREQQEKNEEESEDNNDDSNKISDEKAFDHHKKDLHNIYDYIFFLAYLQEKPELEYTGLESFVFEKYSDHVNTWFPIYKGGRGGNKKEDKKGSHEEGENDDESGEGGEGSGSDNGGEDENNRFEAKKGEGDLSGGNMKMILDQLAHINNKIEVLSNRITQDENEMEDRANEYDDGLRLRRMKVHASPKGNEQVNRPAAAKNLFQKHKSQLMAISAFARKTMK